MTNAGNWWLQECKTTLNLLAFSSIGYTYKCLATGVWALRQGVIATQNRAHGPSVFEKVITELTMAGGDADTNGAVAGSLLGAYLGYSNLTEIWTKELKHCGFLLSKADAATYLILGEGAPYDYKNDTDNLFDAGKGDMSKEEMDARWKVLVEVSEAMILLHYSLHLHHRHFIDEPETLKRWKRWKRTGRKERKGA